MFPGDKKNINPNLSYNKHNQYMNVGNSPVFLPTSGPGPDICNYLNSGLRMPLNMQGDIDWAKLAQQWIHMRDLNPSGVLPIANCNINMPMAPPPPIIGNVPEYRHQSHLLELHQHQLSKAQPRYEEQGEAEMDMDEDENGGRVGVISESQTPDSLISKQPWTNSNNNKRLSIAVLSKNITDAIDPQQWNNWQKVQNSPTAHIPSLLKLNISNPNEQHQLTVQQAQDSLQTKYAEVNVTSGNELDANKRKMLPAWIREGLEKMEREKQRRLEREVHPILDIESSATDFKQVSSQTIRKPDNILNILNVASDSEEDFNSPVETAHVETSMAQLIGNNKLSRSSSSDEENENRCQRSQQQQSVNNTSVARTRNVEAATITGKSYEAKLANLMLIVRRTLTEILLETTNEEIAAIANETIEAHRAEASSAQVICKSALSSITGNLGLAAYGDSSSESEDEDKGKYTHDSATKETNRSVELVTDELKLRIRKSKRAFEKVIDEIEERVSHQAQIDEQNLQQDRKLEMEQDYAKKPRLIIEQRFQPQSNAESFSTSNATSVHNDKLPHFNGKRASRKERVTRFSDNKDSKHAISCVSQTITAGATTQNSIFPQVKSVANLANDLLQIPQSMATMLNAADKALDKANKSSKRNRSRQSSSSSTDSSRKSSILSNERSSSFNSSKSYKYDKRSVAKKSSRCRENNKKHSGNKSKHSHHSGHNWDGHQKNMGHDRHSYYHYYNSKRERRDRESSQSCDESSNYGRHGTRQSSSCRSHQRNRNDKKRRRTRSRSNS